MGNILKLEPVFKEMIWGGDKLKKVYGYDIPSNHTGECWAISAHPNGDCIISEGEFKGMTLSNLYKNHRELFGDINHKVFPLLIKIIDASTDLSVQVHPNDEYALVNENSLGKTECWYVLDAEPTTEMIVGHNAKTKDEFVKAIENDNYHTLLKQFPIQQGDFFYIPAGTLHAICSGSLIYEAQQSSDITYRVYDYHRKDNHGNERELHIKQAIDVTTIPFKEYLLPESNPKESLENGVKTNLISTETLSLDKYDLVGENTIANQKPFQLVSIIEGEGRLAHFKAKKGDHFVICFDQKQTVFNGNMQIMICSI